MAGIYAAAAAPGHWEAALRAIYRAFDGTTAGLATANGSVWSLQDSALPSGAAESYAQYYGQLDRALDALDRGPVGVVRTGTELIPLVRKSEFFEDWMRPYEIGEDGLFVRLSTGPPPTSFVVAAPRRAVAFDTAERVKVMNGLVIHFQQALRTQSKLTTLTSSTRDLLAALDAIRHGVVIVGADCAVRKLNSAAEETLRASDGLFIHSGRIGATNLHAERQLLRALRFALAGGRSGIRGGHSFTCPRPSGKRPYVVHVMPIRRPGADERPSDPSVLVLIMDPERETDSATTLLRRLYGLTVSEAEVAMRLTDGASLKQIADELSLSYETVRTHLQHVFDKTDTHRQAELVRVLLTLRP